MKSTDSSQIREILKPLKSNQYFLPLFIFFLDSCLILGIGACILLTNLIFLKLICSIFLGLFYALFFIVGHDACHQSFTPSRKLNELIGILAFCPTLHNFGLWRIGHNQIHHGNTNFKPMDYVYTPLNREEYSRLAPIRKLVYRHYRTALGHMLYYMIEIWAKKMTNPGPYFKVNQVNNTYWKYQIPVLVYFLSLIGFCLWYSKLELDHFLGLMTNLFLIPFLLWNWIMGFAIYQHHTHPQTRWFENRREWDYWESQIENSVHIRFPGYINYFLHHIMEHTAHHADMSIPMYRLRTAQNIIEQHYSGKIKIVDWKVRFYLDTLKKCKLYNTNLHRWEQF